MVQHHIAIEDLFLSVLFAAVIGIVWGIVGYYRARGQGEDVDWNKLAETVVIAGAAGAGYYLMKGELPSEQDLLIIAPAIIGITASTEKVARTAKDQVSGTYQPRGEPPVQIFDARLNNDSEPVGVSGFVRNNTNRRISTLTVTATFYDNSRTSIGRWSVDYHGLGAYERWNFTIPYQGDTPKEVAGYNVEATVSRREDGRVTRDVQVEPAPNVEPN